MPKLELYIYTTPTHQKNNLVKVGHCLLGRHQERIKEQFNASNPEKPIILLVQELPEGKTDHNIHNQLQKNGIERKKDGSGKEWFYATVDDVKKAYNQIIYGVTRTNNFSLRKEQKEAVKKASKWFNKKHPLEVIDASSHKNRFLLNAKMRFGKCFTGVHIAKAIKAKKTIVVTYKPSVIGEWIEAVNEHTDFSDWTGLRAKEAENSNELHLPQDSKLLKEERSVVLCISLQDLDISDEGNFKTTKKQDRLKSILETDWDLLIFDEVHFGGRTERVKNILEHLKPKFRLDLSGTPFRLIGAVDFCPEQVFTYSYIDEQKNKKQEIKDDPTNKKSFIYREMPDLDLSTIEITDKDINTQRETFLSDDRDFSLNTLFKANSKGFLHEDAVDHFLSNLANREHSATSLSVYGKLGEQLGMPAKRHSVWWLNRVASIQQLIKKMKVHPIFSQYEIINATGGKDDDKVTDEQGEILIAKNKGDLLKKIDDVNSGKINKVGTITLTCRKFLTGVTIKPWDSILILNDIESAESYFQAIFRVQSAWVDEQTRKVLKPKGWIFDFAISRCLRTTYSYADALTDQLDQEDSHNKITFSRDNLTKSVNSLCETLKIKTFYEGSLKSDPVTTREVFEAVASEGAKVALAKRITSDLLASLPSLVLLESHPHLYEALKNVKGYRTQEIGSIEDFIELGKKAKEKQNLKEEDALDRTEKELEEEAKSDFDKEKDKKSKNRKAWYMTQIKRLAICMADFIYMTEFREYKIDHVIETKDSRFFEVVTGINKGHFSELCDKGFIHKESLNRIVREFRHQEESSLEPGQYILEHINKKAA